MHECAVSHSQESDAPAAADICKHAPVLEQMPVVSSQSAGRRRDTAWRMTGQLHAAQQKAQQVGGGWHRGGSGTSAASISGHVSGRRRCSGTGLAALVPASVTCG